MAISDAALWHQVHAEREDGVAAMFLVRDIKPRLDQPQMFVIELPYPITDGSKLPDAESYQRLDTFQEQWVEPACEALGWTFVASKSEDGSFFLYLYGSGDPNALLEKLAPFDGALGFFSEVDADWSEYAALRELVAQAEAAGDEGVHVHGEDCEHDHEHEHDHVDSDEDEGGISFVDLSDTASSPRRFDRAPTVNLRRPKGTTPPRTQAGPTRSASQRRARKAKPKARAKAAAASRKPPGAAKAKPRTAARTRPAKKAASAQRASKRTTGKRARPRTGR